MPQCTIQKQQKWFGFVTILFLVVMLLYISRNSLTLSPLLSTLCDCRLNRVECLDFCKFQFVATDSQIAKNKNMERKVMGSSKHPAGYKPSPSSTTTTNIQASKTNEYSFSSTSTTTSTPSTSAPTSVSPSTSTPTSVSPSTSTPTYVSSSTSTPTSVSPSTSTPTPTSPSTSTPTSVSPSTSTPASVSSSTSTPTSVSPSTSTPTSVSSSTSTPTSVSPSTSTPTSVSPSTSTPTYVSPSTSTPISVSPSTSTPTSVSPFTSTPTSISPSTSTLTTVSPSTSTPTSVSPSTSAPTSVSHSASTPTSVSHSASTLTSVSPSTSTPTSLSPSTSTPTSVSHSTSTSTLSTLSTSTLASSTLTTPALARICSILLTAKTSKPQPTMTTKAQHSSTTSTTTSRPPGPVFIPNLGICDACFYGKQLISVAKGWLCSQPRIGNKMFMMASAIALADSWNATFVLPQGDKKCDWVGRLRNIFVTVNTTIPLLPPDLMTGWASVGELGFTGYKPVDKTNQNVTMAGYKQSWKYFQTKSEQLTLRRTFIFNKQFETFAITSIKAARNKFNASNALLVGVHMRIGDLMDNARLEHGYVMANESFYQRALQAVHSQFSQKYTIVFVVATDTKDKAVKMLSSVNKQYNVFWTQGNAYEDLATLSKCNHSIISGGTYGFWAAWLAGGETYYSANFSRFNTSFGKSFISENFYLPRWKPVSWH